VQLNRGEGRHQLARVVFHGKREELRQRYREGQEDQLGALGLVVNVGNSPAGRLRSPRIKGDVGSRFWSPPAIVEEDTGEQTQQQRPTCHNKAHTT
jgi:Tn3 transposase DDE domain